MHRRVRGSYAIVSLIAGYGLLGFRDPFGIRPLCLGKQETPEGVEWILASESVAIEGIGFEFVRDIAPGEAIFIDLEGNLHSQQCATNPSLNPCIFELVYLARPDSVLDGVPVYNVRLRMGDYLAEKIKRELPDVEIDVVMPIPDSSRPAAMQVAKKLGVEYREGFFKNRYVGRTFIMPGQASAQEVGAPEAERHGHRVQGQERADRRRLDRARHHLARNRADGARCRREQGDLRFGGAAGEVTRTSTASTCRRAANSSRMAARTTKSRA